MGLDFFSALNMTGSVANCLINIIKIIKLSSLTILFFRVIREELEIILTMELTINWLAEIWEKFSLWASTQPTFVEVAIGVGLFYGVVLLLKTILKFSVFVVTGLFSGRPRIKKKRAVRLQNTSQPMTNDDEATPFIFR